MTKNEKLQAAFWIVLSVAILSIMVWRVVTIPEPPCLHQTTTTTPTFEQCNANQIELNGDK